MPFDYPNRESTRLRSYDYSRPGAYFVTICAQDKTALFGVVDGQGMRRNRIGEIVAQAWRDLPKHFEHVRLDEFIVMPNHVHGILVIERKDDMKNSDKACLVPTKRFGHPGAGSLSTIIGSFKAKATREIRRICPAMAAVWQSRFMEHIIRDDEDLYNHRRYIRENPTKWHLDKEYW
jgi:putative transposase